MDRLYWISWRAFWVGLGASIVLIGESLVVPAHGAHPAQPAVTDIAPPPVFAPSPDRAPIYQQPARDFGRDSDLRPRS